MNKNTITLELIDKRKTKYLIILSSLVIISALNIGWNYYDIMWWISWYKVVESNGISSIFSIYRLCQLPTCKAPYPPLAILIFLFSYAATTLLPAPFRFVVLKIILVLLPAITIYNILKKNRDNSIALLWLLSLPFIQILFVLQFDVIISLLVLLATYFFINRKYHLSAIALALSSLIKHVTIILLPIYLITLLINKKYKSMLKYFLIYMLVVLTIILPFFISDPISMIEEVILFHGARAPQDLSIWAILTIVLGTNVVRSLEYIDNIWLIPFAIGYVSLIIYYIQIHKYKNSNNEDYRHLYLCISVALLMFITFNKIGNLNYLVWIIPTALMALSGKNLISFYRLTAVIVLLGSIPYALMLIFFPASINAPTLLAEDLSYWNARALLAQSLNYYVFYVSAIIDILSIYLSNILIPLEFVDYFYSAALSIYKYKELIMIMIIIDTQIMLTLLIIQLLKHLKD